MKRPAFALLCCVTCSFMKVADAPPVQWEVFETESIASEEFGGIDPYQSTASAAPLQDLSQGHRSGDLSVFRPVTQETNVKQEPAQMIKPRITEMTRHDIPQHDFERYYPYDNEGMDVELAKIEEHGKVGAVRLERSKQSVNRVICARTPVQVALTAWDAFDKKNEAPFGDSVPFLSHSCVCTVCYLHGYG